MVAIQSTGENGNQMDIAILNFPNLLKALVHNMNNLWIIPIQLSELLEDLFQCLLIQISIDQLSDVSFQWWTLLLYDG
jgi:hypothetical protein